MMESEILKVTPQIIELKNELFQALSKAQSTMTGALKDSTNPFFKSKYADLSSVLEAVREHLAKNGLCVIQCIKMTDNGAAYVKTTLGHKSGQFIESDCPIINTKGDAQGMGSAITYARRYALAAICGIAQIDDDAQAAVQQKPEPIVKISKKIQKEVWQQVSECISNDDKPGISEIFGEFNNEEKVFLWQLFNSEQRTYIKAMEG